MREKERERAPKEVQEHIAEGTLNPVLGLLPVGLRPDPWWVVQLLPQATALKQHILHPLVDFAVEGDVLPILDGGAAGAGRCLGAADVV